MNDDQMIREFFHRNRPATGDEGTYLAGLASKLQAVESIKTIQQEASRRYRKIILLSHICGLVLGLSVAALILAKPEIIEKIGLPSAMPALSLIRDSITAFVGEWKLVFIGLIAATSITLALIPWKKEIF